jgi:hypothetical protein
MRRKRESQKLGSGHKVCEAKYRKFPRAYDFLAPLVETSDESIRSARKMGLKSGIRSERPTARSLRHWTWHQIEICDASGPGEIEAYRLEGSTGAMLALVRRSVDRHRSCCPPEPQYYVAIPRSIPLPPLEGLEEAKRRAETYALSVLPNRKRDPSEITKRPVADWYERLDGTLDYYDEMGRHVARQTVRSAA